MKFIFKKKLFALLLTIVTIFAGTIPQAMAYGSALASVSSNKILMNGSRIACGAYNINDNNYFKLRDIAYAFKNTDSPFEVVWDESKNAINLISGKRYTAVGGEMAAPADRGTKNAASSSAKILLDGRRIYLTAYNINDNNYFKLRDLGTALNFGVDWNPVQSTVEITSKDYVKDGSGNTPGGNGTGYENPNSLDAQSVYNRIIALKSSYPEGMRWTNANYYDWSAGIANRGYGCAGFAFLVSDAAFGKEPPARKHTSFDSIKVGDILRMNNNTHSVVVLSINGSNITLVEGNYNSSIHWGRVITMNELKASGDYVLTRYQ